MACRHSKSRHVGVANINSTTNAQQNANFRYSWIPKDLTPIAACKQGTHRHTQCGGVEIAFQYTIIQCISVKIIIIKLIATGGTFLKGFLILKNLPNLNNNLLQRHHIKSSPTQALLKVMLNLLQLFSIYK